MENEKSLLYPVLQKYYSALKNLNDFSINKDFFSNIASLDAFFSEFRNITFVLQKSIKHTNYFTLYEKLREKYLKNSCSWFVEKRNEITKAHPIELRKTVDITIYSPSEKIICIKRSFDLGCDLSMDEINHNMRELFEKINPNEVYFSARFNYFDGTSSVNIFENIKSGLYYMAMFIDELCAEINEKSQINDILINKIKELQIKTTPYDMLMVCDYIYYTQHKTFERAELMKLMPVTDSNDGMRGDIDAFNRGYLSEIGGDTFYKFVFMHAIIRNMNLMPTTMIVYDDNTFELDSYNSSIKTTFYRKINEVADIIKNKNVREIYHMTTYCCTIPQHDEMEKLMRLTSNERIKFATSEYLCFVKVDKNLDVKEVVFDEASFKCESDFYKVLSGEKKEELTFSASNIMPIIEAFILKNKIT